VILNPGKVIYASFIITEKEPHCKEVVRVILKHIRDQRAKSLGLKAELSDEVTKEISDALANPDKKSDFFQNLKPLGVTADNL